MNINEQFIRTIFDKAPTRTILVFWGNEQEGAEYSADMFELIKSDKNCRMILDAQTGEIIYG